MNLIKGYFYKCLNKHLSIYIRPLDKAVEIDQLASSEYLFPNAKTFVSDASLTAHN